MADPISPKMAPPWTSLLPQSRSPIARWRVARPLGMVDVPTPEVRCPTTRNRIRRDGAPLKGNTGVFVAGVFVPDSEAFELEGVKRLGPSDSLLDSMCPLIVARDGNAVLASTPCGRGSQVKHWTRERPRVRDGRPSGCRLLLLRWSGPDQVRRAGPRTDLRRDGPRVSERTDTGAQARVTAGARRSNVIGSPCQSELETWASQQDWDRYATRSWRGISIGS